jgi:hypothetical protein
MNLTLNVLDKDGVALDVSNLVVKSQVLALTDSVGATVSGLDLQPGATYRITFPADATTDGASTVDIAFPEEGGLDFTTGAGDLTAGAFYDITPSAAITNFTISAVSVGGDTYDGTLTVTGEDITITIDGNITTGANTATEAVTNGDTISISVASSGYHTYSNSITVYDYDTTISVKLIQNITDPLDAEYRKPYPWFFTIQEPCTYNIHVYNAQSLPFGVINYYINDVLHDTATNTVIDTCTPDTLEIGQEIVVREVANCGGSSPILYDRNTSPYASLYEANETTTDYEPELTLERLFTCCEVIDTEIAINPASIDLNNDGIHNNCTYTGATTAIEYTITNPSGADTVLATHDRDAVVAAIGANDLSTIGFTYTPTVLGTYTLTVEITNCCTTTTYTYTFDVCNSWTVTNTDCNKIDIQNLSTSQDITYTLKELSDLDTFTVVSIDDVEQSNITVAAGTAVQLDLQVDNIYTVDIVDNQPSTTDKQYIFLLDCNTKKCKKQLILDYLCDGGEDCDALTRNNLMESYLRFKTLEEIVYQKWDEWKQQQTIYDTLSINDIMEDVITLSKALEVMKSICNACGIKNDCSCEKRVTCSYTLTNAGYLVPTRYASIIVPNNGTDCGCS